jgi:metallo-beta-lactamase class B
MRILILTIAFTFSFAFLFAQTEGPKLKISHLIEDFYIYTTYNTYEGSRIPANGMYVITNEGVVLFDTPWDTTQFQPLLDSILLKHHSSVILCIATHWHSDRTEGLAYYKQQGIRTYTTTLTDELSKKNNKKRAEYLMAKDTLFNVGPYSFEVYYPGPGHTEDNIVIWFDKERILYAGCLIKGTDAKNLGYLGDANLAAYHGTLKNLQKRYADPRFIIISHSDWKDVHSLEHSIRMARKLKKGNDQ